MSAKKPSPAPPTPRLYLATPPAADAAGLSPVLESLLAAADIAAVLVRLADADDRTNINRIKALAPTIQTPGAALLLDSHLALVARAGADGAHVSGLAPMNEALEQLKPDRIVGVGGLHSRHDSMVAGEAGADYLLFGEPDANGHRPSTEAIAERLEWWAELFELPCVGYAQSLDEVERFAAAGADFIMVDEVVWSDARGPEAALTDVANRMGQGHAANLEKAAARQG
ncbi:thiamine phosphate synthase [Bradyrhizobium sp. LHD-71]|uniref:thiamine phosphate synthase n=1 Tax=Bradyrhizobium sp. LHD-71 TaxID=3072141 RepID=UPI00280FBD88|nr:thiamine phosphate synthase [Bradyrhizobium sp. LHD-71]MDQ8726730.1 thiamine phosphate synthase [Bradyrhizobium sp. LHD-71]